MVNKQPNYSWSRIFGQELLICWWQFNKKIEKNATNVFLAGSALPIRNCMKGAHDCELSEKMHWKRKAIVDSAVSQNQENRKKYASENALQPTMKKYNWTTELLENSIQHEQYVNKQF